MRPSERHDRRDVGLERESIVHAHLRRPVAFDVVFRADFFWRKCRDFTAAAVASPAGAAAAAPAQSAATARAVLGRIARGACAVAGGQRRHAGLIEICVRGSESNCEQDSHEM